MPAVAPTNRRFYIDFHYSVGAMAGGRYACTIRGFISARLAHDDKSMPLNVNSTWVTWAMWATWASNVGNVGNVGHVGNVGQRGQCGQCQFNVGEACMMVK